MTKKKTRVKRQGNYPPPSRKTVEASRVSNQGNAFWKNRSKHGRDTLFESPEKLWEAACEYFKWVDEHPLIETKLASESFRGSSLQVLKEVPVKRPYTKMGLALYFGANSVYFAQFKKSPAGQLGDFPKVLASIEDVIYNQQFEGASSGFFNANIISRALGLAEKVEADVTDNRKQTADLFPTELNNLGKE